MKRSERSDAAHAGSGNGRDERSAERRGEAASLRIVIETQIVPRLMLSHRLPPEEARASPRTISSDDVAELARISVAHDAVTARAFCESLEAAGVTPDRILLDLFAPAARLLGELWSSDRCTFAEVTIGLCVIQRMMRDRGVALAERPVDETVGRIVMAPVPGEQHTLGVQMVADFLRRDDWEVSHLPLSTEAEIVEAVSVEPVDVLGLSVSNSKLLGACRDLVEAARAASMNSSLYVVVGGAGITEYDPAVSTGADLHVGSAEAVAQDLRERLGRGRRPQLT